MDRPPQDAGTVGTGTPPGSFDARFGELAVVAHRVAYRIVGRREDARDITQEALTRAYARWPRIHGHAPAWVARVSTNLALDCVRRRPPPAPAAGVPRDPATHAGDRADLVAALRRLSRRQRDVVVLRYLADLSEADVAAALGLRVGTVKSHAHRGLATLRGLLGAELLMAPLSPGGAGHPVDAPRGGS